MSKNMISNLIKIVAIATVLAISYIAYHARIFIN